MARRSGNFVLVLSVFVVLLLTACGGGVSPIVGEWHATKLAIVFEFFQDGTATLKQDGRTFTGQYKSLDDENIRIDMQGDLGLQSFVLEDYKVSGDLLTAMLNGQQITFSRAGKSGTQNPTGSQVTPASQTSSGIQFDLNNVKALVGKWVPDPRGTDPQIYEFALDSNGKIKIVAHLNGQFADTGTYWDIQPSGGGKFSGYAVFSSSSNGQEARRQALEIQLSSDGQKLEGKQETNVKGKWTPIVFIRVDETKPPTATPVVGSNRIPNSSFEEGIDLPVGWTPKVRDGASLKDGATPAHVWDATQSHSGQHSLGIVAPQSNFETPWELSQSVSVKPGRRYQVALWYRSTLPAKGPIAYLSVIIPRDNGSIGKGVVNFTPTEGEWKLITGVFVPEAGVNKVKLALSLINVDAALDSPQGIWIDDVSFAEIQ